MRVCLALEVRTAGRTAERDEARWGHLKRNRNFVDSLLEGDGFELLVPPHESPGFPDPADAGCLFARKEAGYLDEMNAAEAAIAGGRTDQLPKYLTDRWLADCTLLRIWRAVSSK